MNPIPHRVGKLVGCCLFMLTMMSGRSHGANYDPAVLPNGHEYFDLRDGLGNCRLKFENQKKGRVVFLGGSITAMSGWRELVAADIQKRFPHTKFEFVAAGIPSLGSVPHAFRLERDVLAGGAVDLLFVEAAVNDASNIPDQPDRMVRGMEGVVRHLRLANPLTDIVHMHFAMPDSIADYNAGKVPVAIAQHEKVAAAYGDVTLNLAQEVGERIKANEFTWRDDFKDLHPSPFGHRLYANSIARMLDAAFAKPLPGKPVPHQLPDPVDPNSYFHGRFGAISEVKIIKGFAIDPKWTPADNTGTRSGFVNVPALVGTNVGDEFQIDFEGAALGLFITSGPDAGVIEFSIDNGDFRTVDTLTSWSRRLHLPWALMLSDTLKPGKHTAHVRIAKPRADNEGTALRVFHLLLN